MAQRVTIRKRTPYNTKSNRRRVVKTPGGKLVYQHLKKLATAPKCGDCGVALPGVSKYALLFELLWAYWAIGFVGACSPSPPIRDYLQTPKDCTTGIRWKQMW
jgi:hypothetical protein